MHPIKLAKNIEKGVKKYFEIENKIIDYEKFKYNYEINLIHDKRTINAFAMPNAKIVFFSRILEFTNNDDEIATIMAHEMGHVVAWHSKERMSHAVAFEILSTATGGIVGAGAVLADIGYFLPFSRFQETEADKLGLIFMTLAGYNPKHSINFWMSIKDYSEKVKKYKSDKDLLASFKRNLPEFLSTHPLTDTRIENLKKIYSRNN